MTFYHI